MNNKQTFLSSLHNFEDSLLHFVNNAHMKEIRGLLGIKVVTDEVHQPSCFVIASHELALSLYDFQKLCSVLCAYRFFEIISLRAQCVSWIPTSSPTASMFLPGPRSVKDDLDVSVWSPCCPSFLIISQGFSCLQDWPQLAINFRKLVRNATDSHSQFRSFSNPVFTLMHMATKNNVATKYLAIEENFLLAAIHVAAMKSIQFKNGNLPDLPANMPSVPLGWVSFLAPQHQCIHFK